MTWETVIELFLLNTSMIMRAKYSTDTQHFCLSFPCGLLWYCNSLKETQKPI